MTGTEPTDLDLSPSTPPPAATTPVARKRVRNWLIMGVLVVALGAILVQAVTSASVFYYNVDEAIDRQAELGDSTFRLQGSVVGEPQTDAAGALVFPLGFDGQTITVRHIGEEPTDLFKPGMPVIAQGRWDGDQFESTQLLVKHSESYVAENEGRDGVGYDPESDPVLDGPVLDNAVLDDAPALVNE